MVRITSGFEAGSIRVISCDDPSNIVLELVDDIAAEFREWFYFRISGAAHQALKITIRNAGEANPGKGLIGMPVLFDDYRAQATYDLEDWFTVGTEYDGTNLFIEVTPETDSLHLATYVPYSHERYRRLIGRALRTPDVSLEWLGQTPGGRDLDCLRIGPVSPDRKVCWVTARQHPSETQASWCVEGLIERLLDPSDALAAQLREKTTFYVVPNINPDGSVLGHTRTNQTGFDLNREWSKPLDQAPPEVAMVKGRIEETGLAFALDMHSWSGQHNFALGPYNVPSVTPRQTALWSRYEAALADAEPGFRVGHPYPGGGPAPGQANLGMSWNYFAEAGAFSVLYELLHKADVELAEGERDVWTPERCQRFGRSTVDALSAVIDDL